MPDVQDLVDEASAILLAPVTLEDRRFRLLAFAAHEGSADSVRVETVLSRGAHPRTREWFESFGIARATGPVHVPADPERGTAARLCLPARWHGVVQGYLWAVEPPEGLSAERVRAAGVVADQAGEHLARLTSRRRETERLVLDLLDAGPDGRVGPARELADQLAVDPGSRAAVVVLGAAPGVRLRADEVLGPGGVPRRIGVAERSGDLVLVVPAQTDAQVHEAAEGALQAVARVSEAHVVAGVGDLVALTAAATSLREARAALRVVRPASPDLPRPPATARVHPWASLGIERLLGGAAGDELVEAVRTPAVAELLSAAPELVETAWVHLEEGCSVGATSARLGLHRQSVYTRLRRIESVTGLDLSRGRDRLELHLGLLVLRP
ncbi:PucR family transcriptional regulator [Janibacter sp. G368]|uniref:PucR family transcriptional regulator n=1 Tax=Janibacter sp. G368 TaxID=3420441 RepID=UPI003CFCB886